MAAAQGRDNPEEINQVRDPEEINQRLMTAAQVLMAAAQVRDPEEINQRLMDAVQVLMAVAQVRDPEEINQRLMAAAQLLMAAAQVRDPEEINQRLMDAVQVLMAAAQVRDPREINQRLMAAAQVLMAAAQVRDPEEINQRLMDAVQVLMAAAQVRDPDEINQRLMAAAAQVLMAADQVRDPEEINQRLMAAAQVLMAAAQVRDPEEINQRLMAAAQVLMAAAQLRDPEKINQRLMAAAQVLMAAAQVRDPEEINQRLMAAAQVLMAAAQLRNPEEINQRLMAAAQVRDPGDPEATNQRLMAAAAQVLMAAAQVRDPKEINQQRLKEAAEAGDIGALYKLIPLDPHLLEKFDKIPFVDTPLHVAVSAGQTQFALEMMRLKPSFARKPNHRGFSPIHLVLHHLNRPLANQLVEVDPDLVRVKGRMGITPLHYVAKTGELDLLTKFLVVCPKSIEDLTIRSETALHVAMKNERYEAVKVLVNWLQRSLNEGALGEETRRKVLNWKDAEGNTVLHIAASSDGPQMMRWLVINGVDVNSKDLEGWTVLDTIEKKVNSNNLRGWTPVDIIEVQRYLNNKAKLKNTLQLLFGYSRDASLSYVLFKFGALRAASLRSVTLEKYLTSRISCFERFIIFFIRRKIYITSENRNALLVVAVLMVTATYQTGINPPGGFWKDNYIPPNYLNTTQINITEQINTTATMAFDTSNLPPHSVGTTVLTPAAFFIFTVYNSTVLWTSIAITFILLPRDKLAYVLLIPLSVFLYGHFFSVLVISGDEPLVSYYFPLYACLSVSCISALIFFGSVRERRLKNLLVHQTLSQ